MPISLPSFLVVTGGLVPLLFAAPAFSPRATSLAPLVEDTLQVPASGRLYFDFAIQQQPVAVLCEFRSLEGAPLRAGLSRIRRNGRKNDESVLFATDSRTAGTVRWVLREPGRYAVILENQRNEKQQARLRVDLDFSPQDRAVTYLSPERRLAVILASFTFFFGVLFWSGRKLLRSLRGTRFPLA